MEDIKKNLDVIRGEIAEKAQQCGRSADDVLLVAVSKTRTSEKTRCRKSWTSSMR